MSRLLERLNSVRVLLCDGGMGTGLQKLGLEPGVCPELLNVEQRDMVLQVTAGYVSAGSDLVETNTFGGTRYKLKHYGLDDRTAELNRAGAEVAREAAGPDRLVLGSVGPTGEFMAPLGLETEENMYEAFKEQVMALAAGGVDAICIETMTALEEAKVALKAAKENTNLPVINTFTFDRTASGEYRTMMGISPAQAAEEMTAAGSDIIGSNCGNGPEDLLAIAKELRAHTDRLLMIQPNAGMPVLEEGKTVFKAAPAEMAACVKPLVEAGANIIGGCCGTTDEHLTAMRAALDSLI